MIFKLLLSVALAAPICREIVAATDPGAAMPLLTLGAVLLALGYHRNLLDDGGAIPWGRVVIPTQETMRVRYTIWGLPLAPARRCKVGRRLRERAAATPLRAAIVEALPAALRWLARKVGA